MELQAAYSQLVLFSHRPTPTPVDWLPVKSLQCYFSLGPDCHSTDSPFSPVLLITMNQGPQQMCEWREACNEQEKAEHESERPKKKKKKSLESSHGYTCLENEWILVQRSKFEKCSFPDIDRPLNHPHITLDPPSSITFYPLSVHRRVYLTQLWALWVLISGTSHK